MIFRVAEGRAVTRPPRVNYREQRLQDARPSYESVRSACNASPRQLSAVTGGWRRVNNRKEFSVASMWRKKRGSDTWHKCSNCSNWPRSDYTESANPSGEKCNECRGKISNNNCS